MITERMTQLAGILNESATPKKDAARKRFDEIRFDIFDNAKIRTKAIQLCKDLLDGMDAAAIAWNKEYDKSGNDNDTFFESVIKKWRKDYLKSIGYKLDTSDREEIGAFYDKVCAIYGVENIGNEYWP